MVFWTGKRDQGSVRLSRASAHGSQCVVTFLEESIMAENYMMRGGRSNVRFHTLPFFSREVLCLCGWFAFQKILLPGTNICTNILTTHIETQGPHSKTKGQGARSEPRWSWRTAVWIVFSIRPHTGQKIKMKEKANVHKLERLGQNSRNFKLNEYTGIYIIFLSGFSERIVLAGSI